LKRRSNTKPPHDPYVLYLDEAVSGKKFVSLLKEAGLCPEPFEKLLRGKRKTPDSEVIEACSKAGYVLVTKDQRIESDWTDDILKHKARIILLTDDDGGPIHWMAALSCGFASWNRALLDHPGEPLTIRLNRSGHVTKIAATRSFGSEGTSY